MSLPTPDGTPIPPDSEQQQDSSLLLAQGIRSLALKKYPDACDNFSRAVEQLTEKHGEMAPECGDALILYGKALLYNAIAQSAVLGGGPDANQETEQAVQNAVAGPSSGSSAQPLSAATWKFSFGGDAPDDEEEDGEEGDEGDEEEEEEGAGGVDRDDELESAFAALEQARIIFTKVEGDEAKQKVAEVHKLLGEVEQESSHFDNAVTEYTSALTLLSSILPPYNRSLSELHMLIALALDFIPDSVDRAVNHAEKAKAVLLLKLEQLEKIEDKSDKDQKEIVDIKELMGDVDMKIEDLKVVPVEAPKTEAELKLDELLKGAASGAVGSSGGGSGIVNNLNSLVKKKKKVVVEAEEEPVVNQEEEGKEKRKAEDSALGEGEPEEKKVKIDA